MRETHGFLIAKNLAVGFTNTSRLYLTSNTALTVFIRFDRTEPINFFSADFCNMVFPNYIRRFLDISQLMRTLLILSQHPDLPKTSHVTNLLYRSWQDMTSNDMKVHYLFNLPSVGISSFIVFVLLSEFTTLYRISTRTKRIVRFHHRTKIQY